MVLRSYHGMAVVECGPMTAEQYFALPETNRHYELFEGMLLMAPSPLWDHQEVVGELYSALRDYRREHGGQVILSPMDVRLGDSVFQPDLGYVASGREGIIGERVEGPPDLVIEVTSTSTCYYDEHDKLPAYANAGVREAWLVDPRARTIAVHVAHDGQWAEPVRVSFGEQIPSTVVDVGDAGLGAFGG